MLKFKKSIHLKMDENTLDAIDSVCDFASGAIWVLASASVIKGFMNMITKCYVSETDRVVNYNGGIDYESEQ